MYTKKDLKTVIELIDACIFRLDDLIKNERTNQKELCVKAYFKSRTNVRRVTVDDDGRKIEPRLKAVVPLEMQGELWTAMLRLEDSPGVYSFDSAPKIRNSLLNVKRIIEDVYASLNPSRSRIFYSWQADLPNKTNRGFIEDCLGLAIKAIPERENIFLDADVRGIFGAKDIITEILKKLDDTAVFIADLSLTMRGINKDKLGPNSNVMYELGYAMKAVGDDNIIMVFNCAFGGLDQMPFDLGLKRHVLYDFGENDEDKAVEKKKLVTQFAREISGILNKKE